MNDKKPTRTIEIVAGYSGTVNTGNYCNENPFFSIKEVIEDCKLTDEEISNRQTELVLQCYNKFQAFKEEALFPLLVKGFEPDPKSSVPQIEEIRQKAIKIISEQGKWFQDNDFQKEFRVLFNETFKQDFDDDLQKLSFSGARTFNRKLGALQDHLSKKRSVKIKEKTQ